MNEEYYFPRIKNWKLGNDMEVVWNPRKEANSIRVQVFVNLGSANEPKENPGIAHFLEHLVLFSPTKSFSSKTRVDDFIEKHGLWVNGATHRYYTKFYFDSPINSLSEGMRLIKEKLFFSKISSQTVDQQRKRIIQEIREEKDDNDTNIVDLSIEERAKEKDSCLRQILGSEKSVLDISRKDLQNLYLASYNPQNVFLAISGPDFLEENVRKKVLSYFEKINNGEIAKSLSPRKTSFSGFKQKHLFRKLEQIYFTISFPIDYFSVPEGPKLNLLHYLIDLHEKSLLEKIRNRGLAYSLYSEHFVLNDKAFFYITGNAKDKKTLNEIFSLIIENKSPFNEQMFKESRKKMIQSFLTSLESPSFCLDELGYHFTRQGKVIDFKKVIKEIKNISFLEIKEIYRKMISSKDLNVLTLGNFKDFHFKISDKKKS